MAHRRETEREPQVLRRRLPASLASLACALMGAVAIALSLGCSSLGGAGRSSGGARAAAGGEVADGIKPLARPALLSTIKVVPEDSVRPTLALDADSYRISSVSNADDFYLDDAELAALDENGFCVGLGGSDEFHTHYEMNRYAGLPNFVTVDSMMHAYHLYFSHLLKQTERTALAEEVATLGRLMLEASLGQARQAQGTPWEDAAWRNVAFFAIGSSLADPTTTIPPEVADVVGHELDAIVAAQGIADSAITGAPLDYSQFAPRGYYEGDEGLERYFRTMMWYGQVNLTSSDEDLDRSAALMTCALDGEALETWERVYAVTSFFAGASDDNGYCEWRPLVDEAFGDGAGTAELLSSDDSFARFHELTAQAQAPHINSLPVMDTEDDADRLAEGIGFRLMGQRFSLDAAIFQKLVYREVGEDADGQRRLLPDALDIPAAMGSDEALSLLEERGAGGYEGYSEHMEQLRSSLAEAPDTLWSASLYSQWLHTIRPLLTPKGEGYPPFMRSQAWTRKDLQTYLGSYAELKHDTVLYSKQVMAEMGGMVETRDDRGYVEPEPVVFARLAELTRATSEGLAGLGMLSDDDAENLSRLAELADRLSAIATKELAGEVPTDDEFELIRSYGGQLEHFWQEVYKDEADDEYFTTRDFPAAVVTDVATDPNGSCLELGVGRALPIYVIVPVDGGLRVASGTVFSFYQFEWPLSDRLTDTAWRQMVDASWGGDGTVQDGIAPEDWARDFIVTHDR